MKAKLIVEGKEFEVELNSVEVEKLLKPHRKTGYERVGKGALYCFVDADGILNEYDNDEHDDVDDAYYEQANYYSEVIVAEHNARADKLMRQLRRFAVFHRNESLDWYCTNGNAHKYYICYDYSGDELRVNSICWNRDLFGIYFDSKADADAIINLYRDELIWYFTEYKDSL